MDEFLAIARAFSDEGRVRILLALRSGELCVCQMVELLALAPSTVSRHVAVLKQAGLVTFRKDGRWVYYRLAGKEASPVARGAMEWLFRSVGVSRRAREDRVRLQEILEMDRETLCNVSRGG